MQYVKSMRWHWLLNFGSVVFTGSAGYVLAVGDPLNNPQAATGGALLTLGALACHGWLLLQGRSQRLARDKLAHAIQMSLHSLLAEVAALSNDSQGTRQKKLSTVQKLVMAELRSVLIGEHPALRATLFTLNADTGNADVACSVGRSDRPKSFIKGTKRGDAALEFMKVGNPETWPNLDRKRPEGWAGSAKHYLGFISCPVDAASEGYGMVSFDVPEAGKLKESDQHIVEIFSGLIGLATTVASKVGAPPAQRVGMS